MSDEADLVRLTEALVSPRAGIVTSLVPQPRATDEPSPPHLWNATLAHFRFQETPIGVRITGGKGRTETEAKLSALGEAIERYAAFEWDAARVRVGPVGPNALTPADCVLYSAQQYEDGIPFARWSPETLTSWITGTQLPSGLPIEMPASQVYTLGPPPRWEDYFTAAASNGLAAGKDLDHAILGGLHEVIERDAFMITWLNRLPARKIKVPTRGCHAAATIRHYNKFGVSVRLLWLHSDQAPYVMMAIAEDPSPGGILRVIGLGCDQNPVVAVDKAVSELCQLRSGMVVRMKMGGDYQSRLQSYEAVRSLDDHPLFHAIPAHSHAFDFLDDGSEAFDLDDLPKPVGVDVRTTIDQVVEKVIAVGARVGYADITPADIAALGPRVVRVIISGFQPITFGYGQGRHGGARLFQAPVDWGLRDEPLDENGLNPCPHPLA